MKLHNIFFAQVQFSDIKLQSGISGALAFDPALSVADVQHVTKTPLEMEKPAAAVELKKGECHTLHL